MSDTSSVSATGALEVLCNTVRDYCNNQDLTDAQVTAMVRFAEERFNAELRHVSMHSTYSTPWIDSVDQLGAVFALPSDWLENRWVRYILGDAGPSDVAATDANVGAALGYIVAPNDCRLFDAPFQRTLRPASMDDFWRAANDPWNKSSRDAIYAVHGGQLFVNPPLTAGGIEIGYISKVPPLTDAVTPLYGVSTRLYTYATLAATALYGIEDERLATWEGLATAQIQALNDTTKSAVLGPGPLHMKRTRTFG